MKKVSLLILLAALLPRLGFADTTGGEKLDGRPEGAIDLTDDTDNRASISGNDNLNNSKGAVAFNNDHGLDGGTTPNNGGRFGGNSLPVYAIYEFVNPTVVGIIGIKNQVDGWNHAERSPKAFSLLAADSASATEWTTLLTVTDESSWDNGEWRYWELENPGSYKAYKFVMSASQGDSYVMIQELEFYAVAKPKFSVTGNPLECGDIDYSSSKPEIGSSVTKSAFDGAWTNAAGNVAATCTGYQLFTNNAEGVAVEMDSGSATTCTFTMPNWNVTLQWNFDVKHKTSVREAEHGTASGAGWYDRGDTVTLTATPDDGYKFVCWRTPDASVVSTETPYSFTANATATYVPVFTESDLAVRWLSPTGSDDNDGFTPSTAMFLPSNAVDSVANESKALILALPGTYAISNVVKLSSPIAIEGIADGNTNTVFSWVNTKYANYAWLTDRFILDNAEAVLRNVTVANGKANADGGNLRITANGGLVEDCVIMNGSSSHSNSGGGGNMQLLGGRVSRCIIKGGYGADNVWAKNGGAFWMNAGVIENCLVIGNSKRYACGCVEGTGKVINCTFTKNDNTTLAGLYVSSTAQAINCIIAGNTSADDTTGYGMVWAGDTNRFVNCLSPEWAINETCLYADPSFTDSANGDYTLTVASPARDAGATYADTGAISTTDLAGNERVSGSVVDIGCYEYLAQGMTCDFSVSQPNGGVLPCSVVFVASVEGSASGATLSYGWTVTDANGDTIYTVETSEPTMTWNCSVAGTFDAELTATDSTSTSATSSRQSVAKACQRELYVTSGNDNAAFPYATAATGAKTIAEALDAAVDGCTIRVGDGDYPVTSSIGVSKSVSIVGSTGDPADVIVRIASGSDRLFYLNNASARLANLTIKNAYYPGPGAGVYIAAQGGVVSNCVISSCSSSGYNYGGSGISADSANALITHCVVTNCTPDSDVRVAPPASVYLAKGRIDNSLLVGQKEKCKATAVIYVTDGATVENCTIIDNPSTNAFGLVSGSAKNVIRNTVIYNHAKGAWDQKNAATFYNCAADGDLAESNATCKVVAAKDFKSYANGDYRPLPGGVLFNTGVTQSGQAAGTDLLGKPRVMGKSVDIGCYEASVGGLRIIVR